MDVAQKSLSAFSVLVEFAVDARKNRVLDNFGKKNLNFVFNRAGKLQIDAFMICSKSRKT